jgi:hypothetical protein
MNAPLTLLLAVAGGLCLLVGGWYATVTPRGSEASQNSVLRLFGAASILIAGQEYAALGVYRAVDVDAYIAAVRLHSTFALAAPVAIAWFITLYTEMATRWLVWIFTGVTATVIVVHLASPQTIHFSDVLEVEAVVLPWGERLAQAIAIPSRWPPLADYLMGLFCGLCAYTLWSDSGRSSGRSQKLVEAGLAVLIATIVVELFDPRRVSALPVDEFGFLAFVIVVGFGLRLGPASEAARGGDETGDATISESTSRPTRRASS